MAIIELRTTRSSSLNSAANVRYVYETTYFYDDVLDKKFSKRKVVGKIDPLTGKEIATGPVGRPRKEMRQSDATSSFNEHSASPKKVESHAENLQDSALERTPVVKIDAMKLEQISSLLQSFSDDILSLRNVINDLAHTIR